MRHNSCSVSSRVAAPKKTSQGARRYRASIEAMPIRHLAESAVKLTSRERSRTLIERGSPVCSSIVSRPLGTATFRIDLPRRLALALGTLCASAERTVHMLDIPLRCVSTGIAAALLPAVAHDSELLCCISYFSRPQSHPSAALGRISILLRAGGNFDAL